MNMYKCPKCGSENTYDATFDAYYCANCNEWLESQCDDPDCGYCRYRPEKPLNGQSSNQ